MVDESGSDQGTKSRASFGGWPRWAQIGAVLGVLAVIGAVIGSGQGESDSSQKVSAPITTPQANTAESGPTSSTLSSATTSSPAPAPTNAARQALMPNVVCRNLQEAQDTIQRAGVFLSRSRDATGRNRSQIIDKNWLVVAQDPAPGTPITENQPVLSVVQYGEANPCGL